MENQSQKEVIRTVRGDIDPWDAGNTATHEHLIINLQRQLKDSASDADKELQNADIALSNYYEIRRNNYNHFDRTLDDVDVAIRELAEFHDAGGQTLVEATSLGLGRDPRALHHISSETGVNVVMGSGWYVREFQDDKTLSRTQESLTQQIVSEIVEGVGQTGIRSGLIGEIGMASPWNSWDEKNLRAALKAHQVTNAPVMIHPGRDARDLTRYLNLIAAEDIDPRKVCISHVERTLFDVDSIIELARHGTYLAFDLFGQELSYYPLSDIDMPNDGRRIQLIRGLAEAGYLPQIVISQDIYRKTGLRNWGGEGYAHILRRVLPLMLRRGFDDADITTLMRTNPRNFLSFNRQGG